MMSSKELVYQALAFQPVPRVPYAISFTIPARDKLFASREVRDLYERLDNDFVKSQIVELAFGVSDENGRYVDEYGVIWNRAADPDIGVPTPVITPQNFDSYNWPRPDRPGRFDALERNLREKPTKFQIASFDGPLYERAWYLRGMENLLMDFVSDRDFTEALLDRITDFDLHVLGEALRRYPTLDGIYFGDDYGSQRGLIMGPQLWRELIKPRLAKLYGMARAAGKKVFIHSCGRVQKLFEDFIEIGVDCFNPFQPEVMDTHRLLEEYRGRLSFHGGISIQRLLPYGRVEEVEHEVAYLLEKGLRGGYIIGPSHAITKDAKVENICTMLRMILDR